jgi:hypothetical protein
LLSRTASHGHFLLIFNLKRNGLQGPLSISPPILYSFIVEKQGKSIGHLTLAWKRSYPADTARESGEYFIFPENQVPSVSRSFINAQRLFLD